jgi:hypothetical protein
VVLEVRGKVVKFFDPIGITDESSLVLSQVSLLVANQLRVYQKLDIAKTRWANLQIEKINETEVFPDHDCGIYIFRRVHIYALQHTSRSPASTQEEHDGLYV